MPHHYPNKEELEMAEPTTAELEDAIQRVRELHPREKIRVYTTYDPEWWCLTCIHPYPCPTIEAIEVKETHR